MLTTWGRNVWRYLEPWLAELIWLDPAVAAACLFPEPPPPSGPRLRRLASREVHIVA